MRSLYNAGHKITFVSPFPNDVSLKNYTAIDTRQDALLYIGEMSLSDFKNADIFTVSHLSAKGEVKYCQNVLGSPEVQVSFKNILFVDVDLSTACRRN